MLNLLVYLSTKQTLPVHDAIAMEIAFILLTIPTMLVLAAMFGLAFILGTIPFFGSSIMLIVMALGGIAASLTACTLAVCLADRFNF